MHVLALGEQREASERIGVLAADQRAYSSSLCLDDPQSAAIAIRPCELFPIGRHQLAMAVQNASVVSNQEVGIPDACRTDRRAFVDSDRDDDAMAPRGFLQAGDLRPGNLDCARCEFEKEVVYIDRRV